MKTEPAINARIAADRSPSPRSAVAWLLSVPLYLAFVFYVGQSVPSDYYIYHDYAALQSLQDRLAQDLFPAGIQSYLNPAGFIPLELLLRVDAPSWITAATLGTLHSLNAYFVFLICELLAAGRSKVERWTLWVGGTIGCVVPALLSVIGTSFLDPIACLPMLAALWLSLRQGAPGASYLLAATLAGAGVGLKLSNVPFGLAIAVVLVLNGPVNVKALALRVLGNACAMWAGLLATHGWWSWQLWKRFGNPFFPFANDVFGSPWAPSGKLVFARFAPQDPLDALLLPFRMALPKPWIYSEAITPDLVPAALAVVACAGALAWVWRKSASAPPVSAPAIRDPNAERLLWVYIATAWVLWILTSANGRYALPLFLVMGIALATLAIRLLRPERALLLCGLLLLLQVSNTWMASTLRWSSAQWVRHWISVDVPETLRKEPMLFLSADGLVKSALARHVHPESAFVQLVGSTYSVPSSGPTGEWLTRAYREFDGRTLVVFKPPEDGEDQAAFRSYTGMLSRTLDRAGLAIDTEHCTRIAINGERPSGPNFNQGLLVTPREHLWACNAVLVEQSPQLAASRASMDKVFQSLEMRCPGLYRPAGIQTEGDGNVWTRVYPVGDALIVMIDRMEGAVHHRLFGQTSNELIGHLETWETDLSAHNCQLPYGGARGSGSLRHTGIKAPR